MEKLTDAEVVKALEVCAYGRPDDCDNCQFSKSYCRASLVGEALDIIRRKDAEIERLNNELVSADEVIGFREAEIERLKEFEWMYNDLNK